MASKDKFTGDTVHQMVPITEGDLTYGYKIVHLYDNCIRHGMGVLFTRGATGMVLGETEPTDEDEIHKVLASQSFSRAEDHSGKNIPKMSPGLHLNAMIDNNYINESMRWFKEVRFQGDFLELLGDDAPVEETGTIAVALAGNLALNGIVPRAKTNCMIMREIKLASMAPDEAHEIPWLAIEIDMWIHNTCFSTIGLPRDVKTGYVPLSALELAVEETD